VKTRPGARLLGLNQAEAEYGIPYGTLYALVKRGDLPSVQLPHTRRTRIYLDRRDLELVLERWKGVAR
jgi:hypothetical protein